MILNPNSFITILSIIQKNKWVILFFMMAHYGYSSSLSIAEISKNFVSDSYRVNTSICKTTTSSEQPEEQVVVLREFLVKKEKYALVAHQASLSTEFVAFSSLRDCFFINLNTLTNGILSRSNYFQGLGTALPTVYSIPENKFPLSESLQSAVYLIFDLCPSNQFFNKNLFEKIKNRSHPTPMSLSLSGFWLAQHKEDFEYLKNLELVEKSVKITWVNHTFSHPYDLTNPAMHAVNPNIKLNLTYEILENEKLMIHYEIVPTIFIRVPQFSLNPKVSDHLKSLGLIHLSNETWSLISQQKPRLKSFLLASGNGVEPYSLKSIIDFMETWPSLLNHFTKIQDAYTLWKQ